MFEISPIEMLGLANTWEQMFVLGIICGLIYIIHYFTPRLSWLRAVGPQVPTFIVALFLSNLRIMPGPSYKLYSNISTIGLPIALALLLLSIDLKTIVQTLKPRLFLTMVAACFAAFIACLISGFIFRPDANGLKILAGVCSSVIGGNENRLATWMALKLPEELFGGAAALNTSVYSLSCLILFGLAGSQSMQKSLNNWIKPHQEPRQIAAELKKVEIEHIPFDAKTMLLLGAAVFACISAAQLLGKVVPDIKLPGGGLITISWYILLTTICLFLGSYTSVGRIKHIGTIGMSLLYLAVYSNFAKADVLASIGLLSLLPAVFVIYLLPIAIIIIVAKLLRVDILTTITASMAAIGGAASAPMIPTVAGVPELIPLAIVFATIGYAFANYLGWGAGQILLHAIWGITV